LSFFPMVYLKWRWTYYVWFGQELIEFVADALMVEPLHHC
jgi:hypothetical protein